MQQTHSSIFYTAENYMFQKLPKKLEENNKTEIHCIPNNEKFLATTGRNRVKEDSFKKTNKHKLISKIPYAYSKQNTNCASYTTIVDKC